MTKPSDEDSRQFELVLSHSEVGVLVGVPFYFSLAGPIFISIMLTIISNYPSWPILRARGDLSNDLLVILIFGYLRYVVACFVFGVISAGVLVTFPVLQSDRAQRGFTIAVLGGSVGAILAFATRSDFSLITSTAVFSITGLLLGAGWPNSSRLYRENSRASN